jgi:hypothetical protein
MSPAPAEVLAVRQNDLSVNSRRSTRTYRRDEFSVEGALGALAGAAEIELLMTRKNSAPPSPFCAPVGIGL